ncbi:uncharacterized protein LOC143022227 [Oratosquilla oratoria]|uniref:uncharacterized protein LOC143022227 n=1 Tax=Oratosquilla oratoria TaxID=337810 RepID=UPI003F771C33
MLELMEATGLGAGGRGAKGPAHTPPRPHPRTSGMSTPPARASPAGSREGSPLIGKRTLSFGLHNHTPLGSQHSAPGGPGGTGPTGGPVQQYHERIHATLKRSNSLKRLLKLPIFGGQTGKLTPWRCPATIKRTGGGRKYVKVVKS